MAHFFSTHECGENCRHVAAISAAAILSVAAVNAVAANVAAAKRHCLHCCHVAALLLLPHCCISSEHRSHVAGSTCCNHVGALLPRSLFAVPRCSHVLPPGAADTSLTCRADSSLTCR